MAAPAAGVRKIDGKMIDRPRLRAAQRVRESHVFQPG